MVNLNSLYKGLPLKETIYSEQLYRTFEGESLRLQSAFFLFCITINFSDSKQLMLSWHTADQIVDLIVIPLIRQQNIFEYVKKRKLQRTARLHSHFYYTEGKFGLTKLFCKEEPVIEFILFSELYRKEANLNLYVISESLFKHFFKEI